MKTNGSKDSFLKQRSVLQNLVNELSSETVSRESTRLYFAREASLPTFTVQANEPCSARNISSSVLSSPMGQNKIKGIESLDAQGSTSFVKAHVADLNHLFSFYHLNGIRSEEMIQFIEQFQ